MPTMKHFSKQDNGAAISERRNYCNFALLGFGLFVDGDVGVGVFPEREEVFVGGESAHAGCVGVRAT